MSNIDYLEYLSEKAQLEIESLIKTLKGDSLALSRGDYYNLTTQRASHMQQVFLLLSQIEVVSFLERNTK
jgi:hypothetical protein